MKTILVVEDNGPNMYLLTFLLTKKGYNVFQAFNGEEGVRIALTEKLDLILMDIQLPDIDGYEAIKRIRASWWAARAMAPEQIPSASPCVKITMFTPSHHG